MSYTERPAGPRLGLDQSLPPVNGFSIDVYKDQTPLPNPAVARDLLVVDGLPPQYVFEGQATRFAVNSIPNIRLQVFNVVLEKIVHPQAEETITPLDIWRAVTRAHSNIPKVRAAVWEIQKTGLLEATGEKRRVHKFKTPPEPILRVPSDVRVTYLPEGTSVPALPRLTKKNRGPLVASELITRTCAIPETSPKLDEGAACAGVEYEVFYPSRGQSAEPAKKICAGCPSKLPCMEYAIANNEKDGTWGVSARERREIKRLRALAKTGADVTQPSAL